MKASIIFQALALAELAAPVAADPFYSPIKPYAQEFEDNYNYLKYHGSMGPYSNRRSVGINRNPPKGCVVDQVSMLHRHGERYASKKKQKHIDKVLKKMAKTGITYTGDLEFLNTWEIYATHKSGSVGQESTVGPYAGLLTGYNRGVEYRRRYGHLWTGEQLPFFSSAYERVANTARKFGEGFLGFNYTLKGAMNLIAEDASSGLNTLVPVCDSDVTTTCKYDSKANSDSELPWSYKEFETAAKRLNAEQPGLNLTAYDIPTLMGIAPWELNTRGSSPWVDVFTSEEWAAFDFGYSASYNCEHGYYSPVHMERGSVYANATRALFNDGPENALPMAFSFTHDTDIQPVVAFLGIDKNNNATFDPSEVSFETNWKICDITPQGGHITFERLTCDSDVDTDLESLYPQAFNVTISPDDTNSNVYVRVLLNEAVVPLPECMDGPGKSCSLKKFNELLDSKMKDLDYIKTCNVSSSAPQSFSMFWNWNATNAYNLDAEVIPYQATLLDTEGNVVSE